MKKLLSFVISLVVLGSSAAFAAPDTVSPYDKSTATDIVAVTNPEGQKEYTLDADYVISGYGKEGTVITLYWHDSTVDQYKKIYIRYTCNKSSYYLGKGYEYVGEVFLLLLVC